MRRQHQQLQDYNQTLNEALGSVPTKNPHTQAKDEADDARDLAFRRIKESVYDILDDKDEEPDVRAHAGKVAAALAQHPRNLHNLDDDKNTAHLDALIPKLEAAPVKAALDALNLTKFLTRLKAGNELFKNEKKLAEKAEANRSGGKAWKLANPPRWLGSHYLSGLAFRALTDEATATVLAEIEVKLNQADAEEQARRTRRANGGGVDVAAEESVDVAEAA